MANNCLVKKYKKTVADANILKVGEVKVSVFPNSVFKVLWNNFNASKDFIRSISGTFSSVTETTGYTITAGASGCVVAVSNKYDIIRLASTNNDVNFEFDANQFEFCENVFFAIGRAKIHGNVNYLQKNGSINYFEYIDLSEAEGYVDLAKIVSNYSLKNPTSSAFVTATGVFNFNLAEGNTYKESEIPIPLAYIGSRVSDIAAKGILFAGNIETDMPILSNPHTLRLNGNVTGQLEKWIEKEATVMSANTYFRVLSTSSMTLNSQTLVNANYLFRFNADTVTVTVANEATVIGTYTKATGTWSWT